MFRNTGAGTAASNVVAAAAAAGGGVGAAAAAGNHHVDGTSDSAGVCARDSSKN